MSIDKIEVALKNNEIDKLLLGQKGYAMVYPHFFDFLTTDIYGVLKSINEYCKLNELRLKEIEVNLNKTLNGFITNSEEFYYCLRYHHLYLKNQSEFTFTIDVKHLNNTIIDNINIWKKLEKIKWNGYDLLELCKQEIYGFTAYDGTWVEGINHLNSRLGILLIPQIDK